MYAVFNDDGGGKYKNKVLMYALCDNGKVYPLDFDRRHGVSPLSEAELYEMKNGVKCLMEGGKQE